MVASLLKFLLPVVTVVAMAFCIGAIATHKWLHLDFDYDLTLPASLTPSQKQDMTVQIEQDIEVGMYTMCVDTEVHVAGTSQSNTICTKTSDNKKEGTDSCPPGTKDDNMKSVNRKMGVAKAFSIMGIIGMFVTALMQLAVMFKRFTSNDRAIVVVIGAISALMFLIAIVTFYGALNNVCGKSFCDTLVEGGEQAFKAMHYTTKTTHVECKHHGLSLYLGVFGLMVVMAIVPASWLLLPNDERRIVVNVTEKEDRSAHQASAAEVYGIQGGDDDEDVGDLLDAPPPAPSAPTESHIAAA